MAQFARPSADTFNGDGYVDQAAGSSNIYTRIDEAVVDDADYIRSANNPTADVYVTKLTTVEDPSVSSGHVLRARCKKDLSNPDAMNITVQLRQGYVNEGTPGTLIATLNQTGISTSFTTYEVTLSGVEADLITNYADLYIRIVAQP